MPKISITQNFNFRASFVKLYTKERMLLHKIIAPDIDETEPLKLLHLCILSNKWITITQCDSDSYLFLTLFGPLDEIVDLINQFVCGPFPYYFHRDLKDCIKDSHKFLNRI